MSEAHIRWISGPVLRAATRNTFHVHEAIAVGPAALPGEVIQLKSDEFVAQIYEDTTGLKPGDAVIGTGQPLSVRLGPALLGRIFDGLLRPLEASKADAATEPFLHPGITLKDERRFTFKPETSAAAMLQAGERIGSIATPRQQFCMLPPGVAGTLK